MSRDIALPAPGTEEPQGKPSKQARLGDKPVLPPPPKPLTEAAVAGVVQKAKADTAVPSDIPIVAEAPPPDLRVEREALQPAPMPREKTKSSVSRVAKHKKKAKRRHEAAMMDDENAVVAVDPRRGRNE